MLVLQNTLVGGPESPFRATYALSEYLHVVCSAVGHPASLLARKFASLDVEVAEFQ
jgi:hypothetical protein